MDRKSLYIEEMEREYKRMSRAFCRFISYHVKLEDMNLTEEELNELNKVKSKFKNRFVKRVYNRTRKDDWDVL